MKHFRLFALLIIPVLVLSGCGSTNQPDTSSETIVSSEQSSEKIPANYTLVNKIKGTDSLVKYFGRVSVNENGTGVCYFNWTASGFEVKFKGEYLKAYLFSKSNAGNDQYINVIVDGKLTEKKQLSVSGDIKLSEGLSDSKHTLKVVKLTENTSGSIGLLKLETTEGGTFLPVTENQSRKILYIGDSITAGYGNLTNTNLWTGYKTEEQDGSQTYASFISEAFDAEEQILAVSGMGICKNLSGQSSYVREVFTGTDFMTKKVSDDYDFSWVPDLVVINLGSNDEAAGVDYQEVKNSAAEFISLIKSKYPSAKILWTYGVINSKYLQTFEDLAKELNQNGNAVFFQGLKRQSAVMVGTDGHPSVKTHKVMAEFLLPKVKEITGWNESE